MCSSFFSSSIFFIFIFIFIIIILTQLTFDHPFLYFAVDKKFTAPNHNLVNCEDLNRILKSEIFLHKDGQLRAAHVILGYTPIPNSFQSPKHMIKAKDPRLAKIDVAIPVFLTGPPLKGTQDIELTTQQVAEIIQAEEEVIPLNKEPQELARKPVIIDLKEDFRLFDQPDLAESSKASSKR